MTTQKQLVANQGNAKRGTGPKTPEGKAVASRNAMKTGLLSRELILPGEKQEEFDALFNSLCTELRPYGTLETSLVERIAVTMWRQRRLVRAERAQIWTNQMGVGAPSQRKQDVSEMPDAVLMASILRQEANANRIDQLEREFRLFHLAQEMTFPEFSEHYPLVSRLFPDPELRYGCAERTVSAAYGDLKELQTKWLIAIVQHREMAAIADVEADVKAIPKAAETLSRYQAALDNEWYKAMRAFREAQAFRQKTMEAVVVQDNPPSPPRPSP
jgi:hypothetical protein